MERVFSYNEKDSSLKGEYFMKNTLFKIIIVISWIYCLGHILFSFPTDTFVMRAVTGVMSMVFSCSLWFFLLKMIDNKKQKKMKVNE